MSLGVSKLNFIQTIDERINTKRLSKVQYAIETTGTENTYNQFPIQNISSSGFTITCNPPNRNVFVNRKFYLEVTYQITFTGTSISGPLLQCPGLQSSTGQALGTRYDDAPRAYPLANSLSNIAVNLNGDVISTNLNEYIRALTRYHNEVVTCQDRAESYTPTMLDQYLHYSEGFQAARGELMDYQHNPYQNPRGGYPYVDVIRNDVGGGTITAIVNLRVMEPVYLSPLGFQCDRDKPSFIGLDTITLVGTFGGRGNGNLGGLASALWSHSDRLNTANPITSVSVNVSPSVGPQNAYFQYITPPLDMEISNENVYEFHNPIYYSTTQPLFTSSMPPQVFPLNNIQLNSIPDRMYIWCSKRDQDVTILDTDTYFGITNVNITLNNKAGILSTASQYDLYNMSVRNGINMDFTQFIKRCGSVLCLKFGEDIPLANLLTSGVRGSYNFSAQVTCQNIYGDNITPSLNVLFVSTGTYTISNGSCYRSVGDVTESDVLNTRNTQEIPMQQPPAYDALGGLNWSDVVNFFKKAGRAAINVAKVAVPQLAPQYLPAVTAADFAAQSLGFGKMRGGRKLTRKQMIDMMR